MLISTNVCDWHFSISLPLRLSERLTAARAKAQALAKAASQSSVQQQSVWDTSGHTSMQKYSSPAFSPVAKVEPPGGGGKAAGAAVAAAVTQQQELSEEEQKKVDEDLWTAAVNGNEEGVRNLLARGANPNGYKNVR